MGRTTDMSTGAMGPLMHILESTRQCCVRSRSHSIVTGANLVLGIPMVYNVD